MRIRSNVAALATPLAKLYQHFDWLPASGFFDATVSVRHVPGLRRVLRPQVRLIVDATIPFEPFPAINHLPLLEWGMNFALAERGLHSLLLHAGVVERHGKAVLLPAIPGSGKSTLTAALMCDGYRLLSDEFGVVGLADGRLHPMVRPVALKNESIGVISNRYPAGVMGPTFDKTRKGRVAHLAPSLDSALRKKETARPSLVVFPQFRGGAALRVEPVDPVMAFGKLCVNSFNYEYLGPRSFGAISRLVQMCTHWRVEFGGLDDAIRAMDDLLAAAP